VSIMIMSRLFKMNLGGCNRKLLAVRLADFADDEGRGIYPGVRRLAEETELSERTIQRILADFVKEGILVVVREATGRRGVANADDFDLACLFAYKPEQTGDSVSPVDSGDGVTNEQVTGDTDDADGCHGVTLTVIEPPIEPSSEREGACASSDEDQKKIEKAFKAWYPTWPTYLSDSQDAALAAWLVLSAEDRAACIERTPAFLAAVKANKGKTTYASVYLKGKAWEKLDDPKSDVAPTIAHNPFSRAWMARRFAELLKPAATVMPSPSQFQQQQLRAGGDAAEAVRIDRLQKYGWPRVNTMHQRAEMAQGVTVAPSLVSLSEGFQSCKRDSELARRWEAYHASQGWPWLPMPKGIEWLYFPAGEPDEAISELGAAIARERGNDDAG
jgi:hypothetical protein